MRSLTLASLTAAALSVSECPSEPCADCAADFAIYDPPSEEDGVWEEEVTALTTLLTTYGWTWERVDDADIEAGRLGAGEAQRYRALLAPGGYAWYRDRALSAAGEENLRQYLEAGGGFLGFCAGSYWTSPLVVWAQEATGGGGGYNQASDYEPIPYDLALFDGEAVGPLGWVPWAAGQGATLEATSLDTTVPEVAAALLPPSTRFFYYGGPFFRFTTPPPGLQVWARALPPDGLPAQALTGAGEAMVVDFKVGQGRVVLFSHHPEVLIGSEVDGVTLTTAIDETQIEWDTGGQSWEEIWWDGWNIVHAGLQAVLGEEITPLPFLP